LRGTGWEDCRSRQGLGRKLARPGLHK
jgi:hypothetical protein